MRALVPSLRFHTPPRSSGGDKSQPSIPQKQRRPAPWLLHDAGLTSQL